MLFFSFSILGIILILIGHIFLVLFLTEIAKINSSAKGSRTAIQISKSVFFYIISIIIYIAASIYSTPSTVGVAFAFFIILYDLYCFNILKKKPTHPYLYYPFLFISLLAIITNILHSPPSFDNIGLIEVIHLLYSPVGSYLTILYIFLQFLFAILSYFGIQIASILNASFLFASVINLTKLMGNCIALSIRIENQFQIYLFYPFFISFIISCVWFFFAIKKVMSFEMTGIYMGVFYFSYLVVQIASATLLYGDPMTLNPIQVGIFLASAVLLVFSMFAMSCGAFPLLPSNMSHLKPNLRHHEDLPAAFI